MTGACKTVHFLFADCHDHEVRQEATCQAPSPFPRSGRAPRQSRQRVGDTVTPRSRAPGRRRRLPVPRRPSCASQRIATHGSAGQRTVGESTAAGDAGKKKKKAGVATRSSQPGQRRQQNVYDPRAARGQTRPPAAAATVTDPTSRAQRRVHPPQPHTSFVLTQTQHHPPRVPRQANTPVASRRGAAGGSTTTGSTLPSPSANPTKRSAENQGPHTTSS